MTNKLIVSVSSLKKQTFGITFIYCNNINNIIKRVIENEGFIIDVQNLIPLFLTVLLPSLH